MYPRIFNGAVSRWQKYAAHAQSEQQVGLRELRIVYGIWLFAFALKLAGSSWDVAWHFRYLREDLAIPHVVNTIGLMVGMAVLAYQTVTGFAVDRWGLRLAQAGVAIFLVAVPLDVLNHRLFGLDLTSFSPTHIMLYLGTAVMLIGVIRSWLKLAPGGWTRRLFGLALWGFLLEDVLFALGQQEYGRLAIDAFDRGHSSASPELIAAGGANLRTFALGGVPVWVYPVWLILSSVLVLAAARQFQGGHWTATSVAALYLGYRYLAYVILTSLSFPPSFIPLMLLGGAVVIDLAMERQWGALLTTALLVGVYYASAWLIAQVTLMPQFPLVAAPVIALVLWSGWAMFRWWQRNGHLNRPAWLA